MNNVSFVDQLCSVKHVQNVQNVAQDLPVGARLNQFEKLVKPWGPDQRGLYPPFPDQTKRDKVTNHHKLLCKSSQEPLPVGGIASAYGQK